MLRMSVTMEVRLFPFAFWAHSWPGYKMNFQLSFLLAQSSCTCDWKWPSFASGEGWCLTLSQAVRATYELSWLLFQNSPKSPWLCNTDIQNGQKGQWATAAKKKCSNSCTISNPCPFGNTVISCRIFDTGIKTVRVFIETQGSQSSKLLNRSPIKFLDSC